MSKIFIYALWTAGVQYVRNLWTQSSKKCIQLCMYVCTTFMGICRLWVMHTYIHRYPQTYRQVQSTQKSAILTVVEGYFSTLSTQPTITKTERILRKV